MGHLYHQLYYGMFAGSASNAVQRCIICCCTLPTGSSASVHKDAGTAASLENTLLRTPSDQTDRSSRQKGAAKCGACCVWGEAGGGGSTGGPPDKRSHCWAKLHHAMLCSHQWNMSMHIIGPTGATGTLLNCWSCCCKVAVANTHARTAACMRHIAIKATLLLIGALVLLLNKNTNMLGLHKHYAANGWYLDCQGTSNQGIYQSRLLMSSDASATGSTKKARLANRSTPPLYEHLTAPLTVVVMKP